MTPAARVAAAIEILDSIVDGVPAERALMIWARSSRFAGSGDRAAVRDHVFDTLRRRRSRAHAGGGAAGRALMIGALRQAGTDPAAIFTGEGYAPPPLSEAERTFDATKMPDPVRLDYPDWLDGDLRRSLGVDFEPVMAALRDRAPVFLRVNKRKGDVETALSRLQAEDIYACRHPLAPMALEVTEGARRIRNSTAYQEGIVELQDASSQAAVEELLPLANGTRILDFCAGGGGKALAIAALTETAIAVHDADAGRMSDLPERARRADATLAILATPELANAGPWDVVLADAPCSGSGAWRRHPDAKWRLTRPRLQELCSMQADILRTAAALVAPSGRLAYATCSVLDIENDRQIADFMDKSPGWHVLGSKRILPTSGGDGFYIAQLTRE